MSADSDRNSPNPNFLSGLVLSNRLIFQQSDHRDWQVIAVFILT
jgi:hypothetical protein